MEHAQTRDTTKILIMTLHITTLPTMTTVITLITGEITYMLHITEFTYNSELKIYM